MTGIGKPVNNDAPHLGASGATRSAAPTRHQALQMFLANKAAVVGAVLLAVILFVSYALPLFITADKFAMWASGTCRHFPRETPCSGPTIWAVMSG